MTKRLGWMLLIPAFILMAGCGRRASDPEARIKSDLERYGIPETLARAKEAVKADPSAPNYDYLARALSRANQPQAARQALQKAVSLDPTYAPASLLMARLLMDRNKADAAETLTRRVLEKTPNSAAGNELLGRILLKQGKAADSETVLTAAVKHNPRDARLQWALADTQSVLQRHDEALKHYRRAIKLDP
ncbi:MAG: tetratricopeptide repeat protein, partial [Armatimonadia bacterium]